MPTPARYHVMKLSLESALNDLEILAGNKIGPSGATWRDVAETCYRHLQTLTAEMKQASLGNVESFIVFPSPAEYFETDETEVK